MKVKDLMTIDGRNRSVDNNEHTVIEWDSAKIAKRYLQGWFILDLLSTVPFDQMIGDTSNSSSWRGLKALRVVKLARFVRVIQGMGRLAERGGGDIGDMGSMWGWQRLCQRRWQVFTRGLSADTFAGRVAVLIGMNETADETMYESLVAVDEEMDGMQGV